MHNSEWYLMECVPSKIPIGKKNILSITSEASYALSNLGISYNLIEDFYDEQELLKNGSQKAIEVVKLRKGFFTG